MNIVISVKNPSITLTKAGVQAESAGINIEFQDVDASPFDLAAGISDFFGKEEEGDESTGFASSLFGNVPPLSDILAQAMGQNSGQGISLAELLKQKQQSGAPFTQAPFGSLEEFLKNISKKAQE